MFYNMISFLLMIIKNLYKYNNLNIYSAAFYFSGDDLIFFYQGKKPLKKKGIKESEFRNQK